MKRLALTLALTGCGVAPATTTLPSSSGTVAAAAALRAALAEVCDQLEPDEPGARLALSLTCALIVPPVARPPAPGSVPP